MVSEIEFIGNKSFSESELREIIKNDTEKPYKTYIANSDRITIQNFYIASGFRDVEVSFHDERIENKFSEKKLVFTIRENFQHHFGEIAIIGNKDIAIDNVLELFKGKYQETYKPVLVSEWKSEILRYYYENGKPFADVNIIETIIPQQNFQVNLFVEIDERKSVYIGDISLKPLQDSLLVIDEDIVLKEVEFKSGEIYHVKKIEETRKYINKTNMFLSSDIKFIKRNLTTENDTVDVEIILNERKPNYLGASAGFAYNLSNEQSIVFYNDDPFLADIETEFGKRNIWEGSGTDFRLSASPEFTIKDFSERPFLGKIDLGMSLKKINIPFHRATSTLSINFLKLLNENAVSNKDDDFLQYSATFSSQYEFSERERIKSSIRYKKNEGELTRIGFFENDKDIFSYQLSYLKDMRNHFISPTSGYYYALSIKGSEVLPKAGKSGFSFYTSSFDLHLIELFECFLLEQVPQRKPILF
jgi:outer membrane protein assembly factor BamA